MSRLSFELIASRRGAKLRKVLWRFFERYVGLEAEDFFMQLFQKVDEIKQVGHLTEHVQAEMIEAFELVCRPNNFYSLAYLVAIAMFTGDALKASALTLKMNESHSQRQVVWKRLEAFYVDLYGMDAEKFFMETYYDGDDYPSPDAAIKMIAALSKCHADNKKKALKFVTTAFVDFDEAHLEEVLSQLRLWKKRKQTTDL